MVSCGCFPLPLPFLFRISQLRRNKLTQAFPIADILRVYTIHFLELLARTAYARVLLVQPVLPVLRLRQPQAAVLLAGG